jgi:hypothetical protein
LAYPEKTGGTQPISMETTDPAEGIAWQAEHSRRNGAPVTGRVIEALLPLLDGETAVGRRMAGWSGRILEAAMPLRIAGGLHWLFLSGTDRRLGPVYAGEVTDQAAIDRIVAEVVRDHDTALLPWFDGPPQTNEAGRSGALMGGLLWLSQQFGPGFELLEIGSSAGANTMIERYAYDLAGVKVGPEGSPVLIRPDWQGPPPPAATVNIRSIRGCDLAPIDLSDPEAALRLKSYVWAEMTARLHRLDAVIALAARRPPRIDHADAADWVEARLAEPQEPGTTRVLYHSIVWQYIPEDRRARITAAMEAAGAKATAGRRLAWLALETNRETFRHELRVRVWPREIDQGDGEPVLLGEAHAHGVWVKWAG